MNSYEQKQKARRERLEARAEKLRAESDAALKRSRSMYDAIPFGQPILVGHHSEGRDRRYRDRAWNLIGKGVELSKEANDTASRAAAVGTGGISSDDPDAIDKLKAELGELEAKRARMVTVNKLYRAGKVAELAAIGLDYAALKVKVDAAYSWEKSGPYVGYQLSNLGANIRRIKGRIETLGARDPSAQSSEIDCGAYRVVNNVEENRIQVFFPGKPVSAVRDVMKRNGYRWSPTSGAWQRMCNGAALHFVTQDYVRREIERAMEAA